MNELPTDEIQKWSSHASEELYRVKHWGAGFFDVSESGDLAVTLRDQANGQRQSISLREITQRLQKAGTQMPLLLRFPDLLARRIEDIHQSFGRAIVRHDFTGQYRGAFPIKVNQKQEVLRDIVKFGAPFHYGLEVGSKSELLAALGTIQDHRAHLICNGYKDQAFIDMALLATKAGVNLTLVLEMPSELDTILERAGEIGVEPQLGIRMRLSKKGTGYWGATSGDSGLFGLNIPQVLNVVDRLRSSGHLDCLRMLHYHQGSQLCEIEGIREAACEAARAYVELCLEGVPLNYLNLGGGLAVDYEGTNSSNVGSRDYDLDDYCDTLVSTVREVADAAGIDHPDLITESGRGIAAYYSVLLFDILDVNEFRAEPLISDLPEGFHSRLEEMGDAVNRIEVEPESHDLLLSQLRTWRAEMQKLFHVGDLSIRELAVSEETYRKGVYALISAGHAEAPIVRPPVDFLYANFSVFQSLPDHWALGQTFPIIPIHRLCERPDRLGIIADLTCDCDGQIKSYVSNPSKNEAQTKALPVHAFTPGEDYIFGAFLVGAYQETLGDMHNLFGDTHAVCAELVDGEILLEQHTCGDTIQQVLGYLDFDHQALTKNVINLTLSAETRGILSPAESERFTSEFVDALTKYTYLHQATS